MTYTAITAIAAFQPIQPGSEDGFNLVLGHQEPS